MRIGIDISQLNMQRTGIGNYIEGFIKILSNKFKDMVYITAMKNKYFNMEDLKYFRFPITRSFFLRKIWDDHLIGNLAKFYKVDILITPYFATPKQKKIFKIPIIYDLGVFGKDNKDNISLNYFKNAIKNSIKNSNSIITISETVKKEILEMFPEYDNEIFTLYPYIEKKQVAASKKDENLFLYLGAIEDRKNPLLVLEIFKKIYAVNKNSKLIYAGIIREECKSEFFEKYNSLNEKLRENIQILGYVSDEKKKDLLKKASYLMYLSSYEGFGIPIIEAFQYDTIPIVMNTEIAKEVAGTGAIYFDNIDPDLLFNEEFKKVMLKKGKETLNNYYTIIEKQKKELFKFLKNINGARKK